MTTVRCYERLHLLEVADSTDPHVPAGVYMLLPDVVALVRHEACVDARDDAETALTGRSRRAREDGGTADGR